MPCFPMSHLLKCSMQKNVSRSLVVVGQHNKSIRVQPVTFFSLTSALLTVLNAHNAKSSHLYVPHRSYVNSVTRPYDHAYLLTLISVRYLLHGATSGSEPSHLRYGITAGIACYKESLTFYISLKLTINSILGITSVTLFNLNSPSSC